MTTRCAPEMSFAVRGPLVEIGRMRSAAVHDERQHSAVLPGAWRQTKSVGQKGLSELFELDPADVPVTLELIG
jgi:hypothetical protein